MACVAARATPSAFRHRSIAATAPAATAASAACAAVGMVRHRHVAARELLGIGDLVLENPLPQRIEHALLDGLLDLLVLIARAEQRRGFTVQDIGERVSLDTKLAFDRAADLL